MGYQNNTFHGERALTKKEALMMLADANTVRAGGGDLIAKTAERYKISSVTGNALLDLAASEEIDLDEKEFKDKREVRRENAITLIAGLAQKYEKEDRGMA